MENLIKESVYNLEAYRAVNEFYDIKLDANENPNDLFENFYKEFIYEINKININRYPDPLSYNLRKKLSDYTGINAENIICGNGSDEIISIILNTFIDKGDNILIHVPTFPMYKITASILGANVIEVKTDENFNVNIDELIKKAKENFVKIIFICNPNNPTGNIIRKEEILRVLNETESIVVVDEAYFEFFGETVIDSIYNKRLIVIRTLSKAFALAGARVGYAIASKETIDVLNKVKPPYNLNTFSQVAGIIMLNNYDKVKNSIEEIKTEKEYLLNELRSLEGLKVFNGCGNFILIKLKKFNNAVKLLKEYKIGVKSYDRGDLKECIRVTIGTRYENNKFIDVVKRVINYDS